MATTRALSFCFAPSDRGLLQEFFENGFAAVNKDRKIELLESKLNRKNEAYHARPPFYPPRRARSGSPNRRKPVRVRD